MLQSSLQILCPALLDGRTSCAGDLKWSYRGVLSHQSDRMYLNVLYMLYVHYS